MPYYQIWIALCKQHVELNQHLILSFENFHEISLTVRVFVAVFEVSFCECEYKIINYCEVRILYVEILIQRVTNSVNRLRISIELYLQYSYAKFGNVFMLLSVIKRHL